MEVGVVRLFGRRVVLVEDGDVDAERVGRFAEHAAELAPAQQANDGIPVVRHSETFVCGCDCDCDGLWRGSLSRAQKWKVGDQHRDRVINGSKFCKSSPCSQSALASASRPSFSTAHLGEWYRTVRSSLVGQYLPGCCSILSHPRGALFEHIKHSSHLSRYSRCFQLDTVGPRPWPNYQIQNLCSKAIRSGPEEEL